MSSGVILLVLLYMLHVHAGVPHQLSADKVHDGGHDELHDNVLTGLHCSNQFCIQPGYNKLELPPHDKQVIEVVITPHILEIFEVGTYLFREANNDG